MKKLLFLVFIVGALAFISCTKKGDYTCNCTTTLSFFGQTSSSVSESKFRDIKETDAEKNVMIWQL